MANMSNQSVELHNPEAPIVSTGFEDGKESPLNVLAIADGEVEFIGV
jgi:hypothetical protein